MKESACRLVGLGVGMQILYGARFNFGLASSSSSGRFSPRLPGPTAVASPAPPGQIGNYRIALILPSATWPKSGSCCTAFERVLSHRCA